MKQAEDAFAKKRYKEMFLRGNALPSLSIPKEKLEDGELSKGTRKDLSPYFRIFQLCLFITY